MGASTGGDADFEQVLGLNRVTRVVECIGNVVRWQIYLDLDCVSISGADGVSSNIITPLWIGFDYRGEMVWSEPVIALPTLFLELANDVLDIHPAIDIHFQVELLWSVT